MSDGHAPETEPATHVDALVIGTGQAGKPLAGALAEAGQRVVVVERRERVGGTCVLDGCTPTKTMVASARVAHLARRAADYGVHTGEISVDLEVVRRRKREVVESFSSGSRKGLERHESLELVFGHARFIGPRTVRVALLEGKAGDGGADGEVEPGGGDGEATRVFTADRVFINTGTRNRVPDVEGLDDVPWTDNATLMELSEVPEHLVILGGGFIGLEFAHMFRRFGSEVTVLEAGDRLLPREDEDVVEALTGILEEDGITILRGARARAVTGTHGAIEVALAKGDGDGGAEDDGGGGEDGGADGAAAGPSIVRGTHLMVAVGRRPNSDDLGLEAAGIERTDRGFIRVDDQLRTSAEGVWALGDVNGGPPFTHISYDDFRIVRENVLGQGGASREGRILPYTLFTDPPLGRVGLTEAAAREAGHPVRVAKLPMSRVARAVETDETRGFMKAVVHAETDRILGASILGIEGGEIAAVLQVAMMGDLPWTALRDGVFSHPTLAESLNNLFMTLE